MRINTWEDEKQLVRNKIEELFRLVEDTKANGLGFFVEMDAENAPTIEYTVSQTLVKFNKGEQTDE